MSELEKDLLGVTFTIVLVAVGLWTASEFEQPYWRALSGPRKLWAAFLVVLRSTAAFLFICLVITTLGAVGQALAEVAAQLLSGPRRL